MYACAESQRPQCLSEHAALPHDHGILYGKRCAAHNEHDAKVLKCRTIEDVVVSIEDGARKDKASKDAELDGFV